ncbi:MAG: hypothetical protein CL886_10475 [Dehalococcoidia bacterium]|nr:hypothetical protein [Actinomycetota bacterium]MBO56073.1 hypothetical protein [Dehalococcoidia bacterium]
MQSELFVDSTNKEIAIMKTKSLPNEINQVPLFSGLSKTEMKSLKMLMTEVDINSGKTVVREGDVGREFMIILSGTAAVSKQGNKFASLGPGDFFGEMSLLGKGPRSATITAETDLQLKALNRREFATMLHNNPKIAEKILADAHSRSSQNPTTENI